MKKIRLGEILRVSSGKGIKINSLEGGAYPVYGGNGITGYHSEYFLENPKLIIGRVGVKCGVTHITKPKSWVSDNALIVEPKIRDFDLKFFKLKLEHENLNKLSVSTAQPVISGSKIYAYEVELPDLEDQQRIVAKIEDLFSELDAGKRELEQAAERLKVYRQAVLKWAFEGRLTNDAVVDGELPDGWKEVKIEDIATVGTGATPLKSNNAYYKGGHIAWVTSGALNDDFVRKSSTYVTEKALKENNLSIYPNGTLLLAMYGEGKTRGKCSELAIEATTNQAIAAIHFEKHDVSVRPFLKYFLLKNYNEIRMQSSGGVQPNLNLRIVKKTRLPFPPIEEQHRIVLEIETRLSVCDKIEETIDESLQEAELLRQSILTKAFDGRL